MICLELLQALRQYFSILFDAKLEQVSYMLGVSRLWVFLKAPDIINYACDCRGVFRSTRSGKGLAYGSVNGSIEICSRSQLA